MTQLESIVVEKINKWLKENKIKAIAYRRFGPNRFVNQFCDILIDSSNKKYYLAIEVKKLTYPKLYFTDLPKNQVKNMTDFLSKSGRTGFLIMGLYDKKGKEITFDVVNHNFVEQQMYDGKKGIIFNNVEPKSIEQFLGEL